MKGREEFEALVMKKVKAKQGVMVQRHRAWESVAATVVACFLIVWISYLAVSRLMERRPVGTGEQTDSDSNDSRFIQTETMADTTADCETAKDEDCVTIIDDTQTPSMEDTTEDIGETIPPETSEKDETTWDTLPDSTEPLETSESETVPPTDTTKPPQTSEQEPVTTEPPETSESDTEPITTEPPVNTSGEDDPKDTEPADTSEAETEPDIVLDLSWDQAILEKADFSDVLYLNLNANSLLLSYTYHPILYREDGQDRDGYLRILQFDGIANEYKQMTYLDLVSADGERVTHMFVLGKAQILVSEDEPMHFWVIGSAVDARGVMQLTYLRYWLADVYIDSLSGLEKPQNGVQFTRDKPGRKAYVVDQVLFQVKDLSGVASSSPMFETCLGYCLDNFDAMIHEGITYYRIADSLLADGEVWRFADKEPCPDRATYEDKLTLNNMMEYYIEIIQPYTW